MLVRIARVCHPALVLTGPMLCTGRGRREDVVRIELWLLTIALRVVALRCVMPRYVTFVLACNMNDHGGEPPGAAGGGGARRHCLAPRRPALSSPAQRCPASQTTDRWSQSELGTDSGAGAAPPPISNKPPTMISIKPACPASRGLYKTLIT